MASKPEDDFVFTWRCIGGREPITEMRFHETRKWRFDFAWPDARLAIEIEGGVWSGGRHTRGSGFRDDCEKYLEAALAGYHVVRLTPDMIQPVTLERIKAKWQL